MTGYNTCVHQVGGTEWVERKKANRMGQASTKEYFPLNGGLSDQNILLQRFEPGESSEDELYAADDERDKDDKNSTIQNDSIETTEAWYFTLLQIFLPFIARWIALDNFPSSLGVDSNFYLQS